MKSQKEILDMKKELEALLKIADDGEVFADSHLLHEYYNASSRTLDWVLGSCSDGLLRLDGC